MEIIGFTGGTVTVGIDGWVVGILVSGTGTIGGVTGAVTGVDRGSIGLGTTGSIGGVTIGVDIGFVINGWVGAGVGTVGGFNNILAPSIILLISKPFGQAVGTIAECGTTCSMSQGIP